MPTCGQIIETQQTFTAASQDSSQSLASSFATVALVLYPANLSDVRRATRRQDQTDRQY